MELERHPAEDTSTARAEYDGAHYARAFPDGYAGHFWHRARLRVVLAELARLDPVTVLDIGCGPGQYVKALREAGYDCLGCDPGDARVDPETASHVFPRTDVDALDRAVLARVDVALLLDVVEHLADPIELLARVRRVLPRLKAVVVTAPARSELWSDFDRRAGHHRRHDIEDLSALLTEAGFVVTEATYLFRLLYPAALLSRFHARSRGVSTPTHPRIHACVGRLLAAEGRVLPRRLPGTSVLCVARLDGPEGAVGR